MAWAESSANSGRTDNELPPGTAVCNGVIDARASILPTSGLLEHDVCRKEPNFRMRRDPGRYGGAMANQKAALFREERVSSSPSRRYMHSGAVASLVPSK